MTRTAVVECRSLHKSYGPHAALRGIDLEVEHGEIYGFIGPNGAGKTTTMRILLDILRPSSGSVSVLGVDPRRGGPALRRRIGYLPGELRLEGRHDVAGLLSHYARLSGADAHAWRPWAERLGLDTSRQVGGLSKGNKQKVGLVAAFMHQPDLLILDEPTSGLDPLVQQEILSMLREARETGQTVFLSSHVLSELEHVATRVGVLREGLLILESTVTELRAKLGTSVRLRFSTPVDAQAFAGLPGVSSARPGHDEREVQIEISGTPDAVVKTAARYEVREIHAEQPDLEHAVMKLYRSESGATPVGGVR